jgi:glycosyltransferase 2 family protein
LTVGTRADILTVNKKKITIVVIVLVLAAMVFLQIRARRRFDWAKFAEGSEGINWLRVLYGIGLIYFADALRALRWKIFLRPTRPKASAWSLIAPQYVGFTGLALLGRPGEFIRPYIIARKQNVSFPSQLAIWFVERAFDVGAVTLLLSIDIFAVGSMREDYPGWGVFGYALIALFLAFVALQFALWRHGRAISAWVCRQVSRVSESSGVSLEKKLLAVSEGMSAIKDPLSFLELSVLSVAIWILVAFAYLQVTHAYPADTGLPGLNLPEVILLMGSSVAGGVIQLPVVGGGSQLATIAVLTHTFGYTDSPELAVSCGILLWLVTFMSVVPAGLLLARREHISLRKVGEESEEEAEAGDD